jgi:hypothetical protein
MKKLLTHILTTIILFSIGFSQDFSAIITAISDGGFVYDLTFGFNPDATDGYDEGIDAYAPPAPPPPAFDAALWAGPETGPETGIIPRFWLVMEI